MNLIQIALIVFVILETLNILLLYFAPDSRMGNAVGVFKAWEKTQKDPDTRDFARYLVNWVAGTKLIFIFLIVVVLLFGNPTVQAWTVLALIPTILSFFWRLFPLIKKMDEANLVESGYSKTLGAMIAVFVFAFALVFHIDGIPLLFN